MQKGTVNHKVQMPWTFRAYWKKRQYYSARKGHSQSLVCVLLLTLSKNRSDIFANFSRNIIATVFDCLFFSVKLKNLDVIPVHKRAKIVNDIREFASRKHWVTLIEYNQNTSLIYAHLYFINSKLISFFSWSYVMIYTNQNVNENKKFSFVSPLGK